MTSSIINTAAGCNGVALYRKVLELVRDNHLALLDRSKRIQWEEHWSAKYRDTTALNTIHGAEQAISETLAVLADPYSGLTSEDDTDARHWLYSSTKPIPCNTIADTIKLIELPDFVPEKLVDLMAEALRQASFGSALILDLQDNPGGDIDQALIVSQLMVNSGLLLRLLSRKQDRMVEEIYGLDHHNMYKQVGNNIDKRIYLGRKDAVISRHMPIVVLINHNTASCAELLALILQRLRGATIIGTPSTGKNFGQLYFEVFGRGLHITNFEMRPTGLPMNGPITPDITIEHEAGTDKALDVAVEYLRKGLDASRKPGA